MCAAWCGADLPPHYLPTSSLPPFTAKVRSGFLPTAFVLPFSEAWRLAESRIQGIALCRSTWRRALCANVFRRLHSFAPSLLESRQRFGDQGTAERPRTAERLRDQGTTDQGTTDQGTTDQGTTEEGETGKMLEERETGEERETWKTWKTAKSYNGKKKKLGRTRDWKGVGREGDVGERETGKASEERETWENARLGRTGKRKEGETAKRRNRSCSDYGLRKTAITRV